MSGLSGLLVLLVTGASWLGSWLWLLWGRRRHMLDLPNERSAHVQPVVRGGGVVFISVFLASAAWLLAGSEPHWPQYTLAVLLVMLVGFADDLLDLSALSRLLVHLIAGGLLVQPLWPMLSQSWSLVILVPLMLALVLALVWLINLYNFMDGIDGIATLQGLSVCAVMALICWLGQHWQLFALCVLLGGSLLGFISWNLPAARLFMGDAGSGGLGTIFAMLLVLCGVIDLRLVWCCFLLLSVFVVDASWTLLVRFCSGHKIWLAHNLHAYQKLSRLWRSHLQVSLAVCGYNLIWLGPVTLAYYLGYLPLTVAWLLSWLPLVLLCYRIRAGQRDQ